MINFQSAYFKDILAYLIPITCFNLRPIQNGRSHRRLHYVVLIIFVIQFCDFNLGYKQASYVPTKGCNRTRSVLTDSWGIISDGPKQYPRESYCEWLIRAPSPDYFITLNLTHMDTECSYDNLYIYDGATYSSRLLAVFSGKSSPSPVVAYSGSMLILLYSDTNYQRDGFVAEYFVTDCPFNCSSVGHCVDHKCKCSPHAGGVGCEIEFCPDSCGSWYGRGTCVEGTENHFCYCEDGYAGDGCTLRNFTQEGDIWHWIYRQGSLFKPRTSHSTVFFPELDKMFIFGGYDLNIVFDDLIVYSFSEGNWLNVKDKDGEPLPSQRRKIYSHRRVQRPPPQQILLQKEDQKPKESSRSHNLSFSMNSNNKLSVKVIPPEVAPLTRRRRKIDPSKEKKRQRRPVVWPSARFGHCMATFGLNFVIYGGKDGKGHVNDELWFFNVTSSQWTFVSEPRSSSDSSSSVPPPLVFCTLTLVDDQWLYLFGGGLQDGKFSNSLYRINPFGGWIWEKVEAFGGNPLKARLVGHTTVFHPSTRSLYIYGGIKVNIARFSKLSDQLLVFNVDQQFWSEIHYPKGSSDTQYSPAPLERAFHSAFIAGSYIVVYGGYMHKHKEEEMCYDRKIYLFHLGCHVWLSSELMPSLERSFGPGVHGVYGHSAFLRHQNTLIVVGGFHGTVTNHVIAYVLPTTIITAEGSSFNRDEACKAHETQSSCVSNLECGWCATDDTCYDQSRSPYCTTNLQTSACPGLCPTLTNCQSCVVQGMRELCGWCVKARSCLPRAPAGQGNCGGPHHQNGWWGTSDQMITTIDGCVAKDVPPGLTFLQFKGPANYSQPDYVRIISDVTKDLERPEDLREPLELQLASLSSKFRLIGFLHPRYMEYISLNKLHQGMEPIRLHLEGYKLNATLLLSTDDSIEKLQKVATIVSDKIPSSEATRLDGEPLIQTFDRCLLQLDFIPLRIGMSSSFNLNLLWSLGSSHSSSLSAQHLEPYGRGGLSCFNHSSCLPCLSDYMCGWCASLRQCVPRNSSSSLPPCPSGHRPVIDASECEVCEDFIYCEDCALMGICEWLVEKALCTRKGRFKNAVRKVSNCPIACQERRTCAACLGEPGLCAWCEATKECFLFSLYTSVYQYGACRVWIDEDHVNLTNIDQAAKLISSLGASSRGSFSNATYVSSLFAEDVGECQICEKHTSCSSCLKSIGCGWCHTDFNANVGLCTSGDFTRPHKGNCSMLMENISVPSNKNASLIFAHHKVSNWSYSHCPDVDECRLNLHECHPNATCVNTEGGYNCSCPKGFMGNGRDSCIRTCYEVCHHGKCSGSPNYECECHLGWMGKNCSINCGCNNHSKCKKVGVCKHCQGETTGKSCELCRPGSWGNATTTGCKRCECNEHWDVPRGRCDQATGRCFCLHNTLGHNCDTCKDGFYGDPRNGGKCYPQCNARGIIVNATSGFFGFQNKADPFLDTCLWILSAHESINPPNALLRGSHVLQVTIDVEDIKCHEGSLYIYEGLPDFVSMKTIGDKQNLIGTFCSDHAAYPVTTESTSGVMTIFYEKSTRRRGFVASYEVLHCPENPGENRGCSSSRPTCNEGWRGVQCDVPVCPNKCSEANGSGRCDINYGRYFILFIYFFLMW